MKSIINQMDLRDQLLSMKKAIQETKRESSKSWTDTSILTLFPWEFDWSHFSCLLCFPFFKDNCELFWRATVPNNDYWTSLVRTSFQIKNSCSFLQFSQKMVSKIVLLLLFNFAFWAHALQYDGMHTLPLTLHCVRTFKRKCRLFLFIYF